MSLTGKQIRELNSAYNNVYAKQEPEVENLAITEELFEELCISILAEAFESHGIEIYDQTDLQEVIDPKTQAKNVAKEFIKKGIKGTIKTLINPKTLLGVGIGADATTGGKVSRTGLGILNNIIPFARDMYTAVKGNKEFGGTILKDKEKGTFSTAEQDRKKMKKESVQFALHIVEEDSIKDLIDKKNEKDKKDIKKDTNVINKDDKKSDLKDTTIGNIGFQGTFDEFDKKYGIDKEKNNDNVKKDEIKKDEIKKDEIKKDEIKKDEIKKNEVKKDRLPDFGPTKEVTMKDFESKPPKVEPKISPATFKTNQKQSRELVSTGKLKDTDLNKYSRSNTYTADDGKTQVNRSTVNTIAQFDMGPNIKKGEKLGVISRNMRKKYDMKASSFKPEAYDVVLDYVLSEGHADTVEEAHYVMTQMDEETIKSIVDLSEGPIATAAAVTGALTLGGMGLNAIRKQFDNKKKMEKGGSFKQGSMMDNIQKKKNMLKNLENY